jgi:hypothetical protein
MMDNNYRDQDFKCCYTCSHCEEEAEGQIIVTCTEMPESIIDILGVCDLHTPEGE